MTSPSHAFLKSEADLWVLSKPLTWPHPRNVFVKLNSRAMLPLHLPPPPPPPPPPSPPPARGGPLGSSSHYAPLALRSHHRHIPLCAGACIVCSHARSVASLIRLVCTGMQAWSACVAAGRWCRCCRPARTCPGRQPSSSARSVRSWCRRPGRCRRRPTRPFPMQSLRSQHHANLCGGSGPPLLSARMVR